MVIPHSLISCGTNKRGWCMPAPHCTYPTVPRSVQLLTGSSGGNRRRGRNGRRGGRNIDANLLRLGFLALGNNQREHAIMIIGLDGVGVDGVGKREAAAERT